MTDIISCEIHDYFEIACMRKSVIDLELHTKQLIGGVALDVFKRNGKEYLKLETSSSIEDIELTSIASLSLKKNGKRIIVR